MSNAASGASTGAAAGTAIAPGIGSLLGAAAGGLIGFGLDTWSSDRSREMDQADYQENQLQNFMYGQQAQRNAASNEVAGLLKAGLNPALAAGANPAQMVAAPLQNKDAPKLNIGMAQLLSNLSLQKAETENVKAQAEKASAEAENIKQKTGEARTAGNTAALNLYNYFSSLAEGTKDPNLKAFYESMAEEARDSKDYGSGALLSFKQFNDFYAESFEVRERALSAQLRANADQLMLKDSEVAKAMSRMPVAEYKRLVADMSKLVADRDTAKALYNLYMSQKELNDEEKKRVRELTDQIKDNNIVKAMESGDSGKTVAILLGWIFQAIGSLPGHVSVNQSTK